MLRITKLSDYGLLMVAYLFEQYKAGSHLLPAHKISEATRIPLPTVNKVLKLLTKRKVVASVKGKKGGFHLFSPETPITALQVVEAVDGKISIFECTRADNTCSLSGNCIIQQGIGDIERKVRTVLEQTTISHLV